MFFLFQQAYDERTYLIVHARPSSRGSGVVFFKFGRHTMTPPIPTPPLEGVVFFFLSLQAYDEPTYLIVHAHPSLEGVVL